jgi:outer membrane receptor for ferrienterochelin and colicins
VSKFVPFFLLLLLFSLSLYAQDYRLSLRIMDKVTREGIGNATIKTLPSELIKMAGPDGSTTIATTLNDTITLIISAAGYITDTFSILVTPQQQFLVLQPQDNSMEEVVVTGTLRSVIRTSSPVPVEVYTPKFFLKNPTPSIFDALQLVNGVRPQLNCNVCNTGDIHMNGLEGPYTMVLIDGMPIVSNLASVYGLSGIPNSLVERIEIVKGPASSLYGSEAIGGLINVITKNPLKAPLLSVDISANSWSEFNADFAMKYRVGKRMSALLGLNYFNYSNPVDKNHDHFTDVTLQDRISVFNKFTWARDQQRAANVALRYIYEDRWGGEMNWNKHFRGSDSIYGESIYTSRFELTGNYQLPTKAPIVFSYSLNSHDQQSAYGTMIFNAKQKVAFGQLTWEKSDIHNKQHLLVGLVARYTMYDDNTTATTDTLTRANQPDKILLPGVFIQQEWAPDKKQTILAGVRYDYDKRHGNIFTPRLAWKISLKPDEIVRINAGTGFRVVNLFTEDHAALTGARAVVIDGKLKPERSYNINVNYLRKFHFTSGWMNAEMAGWYTHFTNRIVPDYETNPNQIIYSNLNGYALSKGISLNVEMGFTNSLRITTGATLMNVTISNTGEDGKRIRMQQLLTEKWTGTWTLSYFIRLLGMTADYTGNIYGKMKLPLLSELDPRNAYSPVWSIQNLQLTKKITMGLEMYAGVKNLLNWTPARHAPFLIARSHDPFDKQVAYGQDGKVIPTTENPYALTFDPNYVYGPNQGRRIFAGVRYEMK